ncbi:unnamed protein product, partial [Laminaria digitata]
RRKWSIFLPDFCDLAGVAVVGSAELLQEGGGDESGCFDDHGSSDPVAPLLHSSSSSPKLPPLPDDQPRASDVGDDALRDNKGGDGGTAAVKVINHRAENSSEAEDREPFAVVRGFHYVKAFLPGAGDLVIGAASSPPPQLPPLQLAFPTLLEVL